MARLLLLTASALARDPRARRAGVAAGSLGWDVAVVPLRGSADGRPTARRPPRNAITRELRGAFRLLRILVRTVSLVRRAARIRADVVHANDLDTLPAGWFLARQANARLVYDAHEFYTGFEREPPRLWRWASRVLEGRLARRADAVVTVSDGIADELQRLHRLPTRPLVVLNCPNLEAVEVESRNGRVRAVYQASVGPGRELADLQEIAAAGVDLTARILGLTGAVAGVETSPPVPADELVRALTPFDIGVVIDRPITRNAELALPNKLFEYLMAGLAVVVPRAGEMAALVEREGVGVVFDRGALGSTTAALASDRARVDEMRRKARALAVRSFNAEAQAPKLHQAWGL